MTYNNENMISGFWEYVESQKAMGKKEAIPVYNWLNKDNLSSIIFDGGAFWIEKTNSYSNVPKFAMDYIKRWADLLEHKYLYDITK